MQLGQCVMTHSLRQYLLYDEDSKGIVHNVVVNSISDASYPLPYLPPFDLLVDQLQLRAAADSSSGVLKFAAHIRTPEGAQVCVFCTLTPFTSFSSLLTLISPLFNHLFFN